MTPMRILIDQDGVLAGWGDEWDIRAAEHAHLGLKLTSEQDDFDLTKDLTPEGVAAVLAIMDAPDFYKVLKPMDGAVEALNEMIAEGHEVFIVTSPWLTNPNCMPDKMDWIAKHFGPEWVDRVVLTRSKYVVDGDVLIDDKPHIFGSEKATWQHVYYTQNYNKNQPGPRINVWSEWREVLASVMEEKNGSTTRGDRRTTGVRQGRGFRLPRGAARVG